jgi:hypothetical protein
MLLTAITPAAGKLVERMVCACLMHELLHGAGYPIAKLGYRVLKNQVDLVTRVTGFVQLDAFALHHQHGKFVQQFVDAAAIAVASINGHTFFPALVGAACRLGRA